MACPNRFDVNAVITAGGDLLNDLSTQVSSFVGSSLANLRQNLLDKEESGSSAMAQTGRGQPSWQGRPLETKGSCESCGIRFSVLKRRRLCSCCYRCFCNSCAERQPTAAVRICVSCRQISSCTSVGNLSSLRNKDIQAFLNAKGVSTQDCVERQDLIDKVAAELGIVPEPLSNSSSLFEPIVIDRSSFYGDTQNDYAQTGAPEQLADHTVSAEAAEQAVQALQMPPEAAVDSGNSAEPNTLTSPAKKVIILSKIKTEKEIDAMTSRQLKEILQLHRVDFRGCCERTELVDRAKRLWKEVQKTEVDVDNLDYNELCKICMSAPVECVLLDCGHMATCVTCGKQMNECPICRQYVVRVVRTFKA